MHPRCNSDNKTHTNHHGHHPLPQEQVVAKISNIMKRTILIAAILMACSGPKANFTNGKDIAQTTPGKEKTIKADTITTPQDTLSATARSMESQGMVNIKSVDPTIEKAQKKLKELRPDLSLIIFDATRPMSIQQVMWDVVKGTSKNIYVSNPANGGGMHNYGMAVDISICRVGGDTIPMGAKVDYMGTLSHIDIEPQLVASKRMTKEAHENRQLLREAMAAGGFKPLRTEWWHFNLCTRAEAKKYYKAIK